MMRRIAQDIGQGLAAIQPSYEVVVVGSGYGAGVAASRLARAGRQVALLERGLEHLPGEFPASLNQARGAMRVDTQAQTLGSPTGLYQLHVHADMLAMVGNGLGGTSLINANVSLEADPELLRSPAWPQPFRDDPELLAPYLQRAQATLEPRTYPLDRPTPAKLAALRQSANHLDKPFRRVPINVTFEDRVNPFGVTQPACNDCGDCTSGCNVGAKNTVQMNYLPDAERHGASLFTGVSVSHVSREGTRWRVHYRPTAQPEAALRSVLADVVVLGAGSLGSTEILLRSRQHGLPLSDRLGASFSGNGDVLGLAYDAGWSPQAAEAAQATPADDDQGEDPDELALREPAVADVPGLHGVGLGQRKPVEGALPGPCITGVIDLRQEPDPKDRLVIEEGVIPGALALALAPALFFASAQLNTAFEYGAEDGKRKLLDAKAIGDAIQQDPGQLADMAYRGAVDRTQTFLVMSLDDAQGQLKLHDDRLRIDWPHAGRSPVIEHDNQWLRRASEGIQGQFIANPLWTEGMGQKLVTVHPLGGCAMGDDAEHGVVNHQCEVFAGSHGEAVHEGLYVCDGAVIPAAVGVNPLLTITAVAERACQRLADQRGWTIQWGDTPAHPATPPAAAEAPAPSESLWSRLKNAVQEELQTAEHALQQAGHTLMQELIQPMEDGALDWAKAEVAAVLKAAIARFPQLLSPAFSFSERMAGWVSTEALQQNGPGGLIHDFEIARAWGRRRGQALSLELLVHTQDLHQLNTHEDHPADIAGLVHCHTLDPEPMAVRQGRFQLLRTDEQQVETWLMVYDMTLERAQGRGQFHLRGHKRLHQTASSSSWQDLTTLFVEVREQPGGALVAQGIASLALDDLLKQLTTLKLEAVTPLARQIQAHQPGLLDTIHLLYLEQFAGFFGMTVFQAYGGLLSCLNDFPGKALPQWAGRPLKAPPPKIHRVPLDDGFSIQLTRYKGSKGPVILAPGFSIRASSFATDTVDENLVEALCRDGFDVWLLDYRGSIDSGSPLQPYTISDIARHDWPAAVRHVLAQTGRPDLQVIAHCVGSMTLLMALLEGMPGVRSVIASQLTLHPITNWLNDLKSELGVSRLLQNMPEFGGHVDFVPGGTDFDSQLDAVLWGVPVPEGEACKNPVCRRLFAIMGPSYRHDQLNHATHTALARMVGPVSLRPFDQLSLIMQKGHVVDPLGHERYLSPERARHLALPIHFIAGARNQLFLPETSLRTLAWLSEHNDPGLYSRQLFKDYAHMDLFIGKNAATEVYPQLIAELNRHR